MLVMEKNTKERRASDDAVDCGVEGTGSVFKKQSMGASFQSNLTNILLSARRANVRHAVYMELDTVLISRQE